MLPGTPREKWPDNFFSDLEMVNCQIIFPPLVSILNFTVLSQQCQFETFLAPDPHYPSHLQRKKEPPPPPPHTQKRSNLFSVFLLECVGACMHVCVGAVPPQALSILSQFGLLPLSLGQKFQRCSMYIF